MNLNIRPMKSEDKPCIMEMMRVFYSSPAVYTNGSEEVFSADIDNCANDNPFLDGYVLEDDGKIVGYTMIARSFSTEFGKACIWIEDLYIRHEYRGRGLGKKLMDFVMASYTDCIFRLEVEEENKVAVNLYKKCGFAPLSYREMKK